MINDKNSILIKYRIFLKIIFQIGIFLKYKILIKTAFINYLFFTLYIISVF